MCIRDRRSGAGKWSLFGFLNRLTERPEKVRCLLCFRCGPEKRPVIILQHFKVCLDVSCMPQLGFYAKVSTQECGGEFGDDFLEAVRLRFVRAGPYHDRGD